MEFTRAQYWATHRQEIHSLLHSAYPTASSSEEAIILGAGSCDDLDLNALANQFAAITLVDIEGESARKIVQTLDTKSAAKYKIIDAIDLTKLDQIGFHAKFQSLLENVAPAEKICDFLQKSAVEVKFKPLLMLTKKTYSVVISSAVHTQLFYVHALSLFAIHAQLYLKQDVNRIVVALVGLRDQLIEAYNQLLLSLVKPNGVVIAWTEIIKLDQDTDFIANTIYTLPNEEERARYVFNLMGAYGMEAATMGLKDLHGKLVGNEVIFRSWLWSYDHEKNYLVVGMTGKPIGAPTLGLKSM